MYLPTRHLASTHTHQAPLLPLLSLRRQYPPPRLPAAQPSAPVTVEDPRVAARLPIVPTRPKSRTHTQWSPGSTAAHAFGGRALG
ncbi:uncharacterized protein K452DRAFT_287021 [Aplosporella prunicola CBS 121167]|uniref:Uncharacterized protein n=1 Tax=Aplosporella prunicola CBS 121167 TaxID=1176127 RepID=A0A6A6BEK8_9PEZI|nr:uncharacterized protein K452DRAFT_287021 [Aplosporella prunicola CBS 121167]KAF2142599.1 hypothetical protein K452DRAFT_287021 [Aplosporella prunicola CBS 121167]